MLRFRIGNISDCQEVGDEAHAHIRGDDPRQGAICFRYLESLSSKGQINMDLVVHELAHIQDYEQGNLRSGHSSSWWKLYLGMLKGIDEKRHNFWVSEGF